MSDTHYTVKQAAERLGIAPRTLRGWLTEGGHFPNAYKIKPGSKRGSPYRIPEVDLVAFEEKRKGSPAK